MDDIYPFVSSPAIPPPPLSPPAVGGFFLDRVVPFLWKVGTFGAGLVTIALGLLYYKQDSLLYFPEIGNVPRHPASNPRRYRSPSEHSIPFESHMIECEDGVSIHSWLLLHPLTSKSLPTVLFFHGNAGNIGLRLPNAIQMYNLLNANILMVEYRGYGDSDDVSSINEKGLKLDAQAALRYVSSHLSSVLDTKNVYVFGRSLGGAVGFHLAKYAMQQNIPLAGLIVENTFESISKMVDELMPLVAPFKMIVLRINWDSINVARQIVLPVLYLSGMKDTLVPPSHMKELYSSSKRKSVCARFHSIKDGTHNESWLQGGMVYWDKINSFIKEATLIVEKKRADTHLLHNTGSFTDNTVESISSSATAASEPVSLSSLAVNMGGDAETVRTAIPIMPGTLIGMAKEAATAVANNGDSQKKNI